MLLDLSIGLNCAGVILGLLLAATLVRRPGLSNRYQALLLMALSLMIMNSVIRPGGYIEILGYYENVSSALLLTIGPLMYCYIDALVGRKMTRRNVVLHFVAFALYIVLIGL